MRRFVAIWALEKGQIAFAKDQAEAALRIEASDSKKYGGSHLGHVLRGLVGLWEKNWTDAESCFQTILSESPNDFVARNNIALALVEQDDSEKKRRALDYAEANLRDTRNNPDALSTLGWVHFRRNEFDQAGAASTRRSRQPVAMRTMPIRLLIGPMFFTSAGRVKKRKPSWRTF